MGLLSASLILMDESLIVKSTNRHRGLHGRGRAFLPTAIFRFHVGSEEGILPSSGGLGVSPRAGKRLWVGGWEEDRLCYGHHSRRRLRRERNYLAGGSQKVQTTLTTPFVACDVGVCTATSFASDKRRPRMVQASPA